MVAAAAVGVGSPGYRVMVVSTVVQTTSVTVSQTRTRLSRGAAELRAAKAAVRARVLDRGAIVNDDVVGLLTSLTSGRSVQELLRRNAM